MKRFLTLFIALGSISSIVLADGPCPSGSSSTNGGTVMEQKCVEQVDTCVFYAWNYTYQRTCTYWCCTDASGGSSGNVMNNCGLWASMGCCRDLDNGSVVSTLPACATKPSQPIN